MTVLVSDQPLNVAAGITELGPLNLPQGTSRLLVTYTCGSWPVTTDGQIIVTIRISDNGGTGYRDEWSDTFQHVRLLRAGVVQDTAQFGITLQAPFGNNSRLKVRFNSQVAFSTNVTVEAI